MLSIAIVGLGWWGRHITQALGGSERVRTVAAYEPSAEAAAFAAQHGLKLATSYEALLADAEVDAVILATPHSLHEAQTLAALDAGKAVFCEKPLAMNAAGARRMLAAAKARNSILGVGHERRYEPAMEEALAILKSGGQGKLLHMEANVSHSVLSRIAPGNWRNNPGDAPAGPMTALGVHLTDLFISFAGRPARVRARTAKNAETAAAEDFVGCDLTFASGVTASFSCLSATPYYGRMTIYSQRGWIEVRENGNVDRGLPSELIVCDEQGERSSQWLKAGPAVRNNIESWAAALAGEGTYRFTPDDILDNVKIFEAVVSSARGGSAEVSLDTL